MDFKIEIKEEDAVPDEVVSHSEREFFHNVTIKTDRDAELLGNDCDMMVKTEIKSEIPFPIQLIKQMKPETVIGSDTWEIDTKSEIEQHTLISDLGSQNGTKFLPEDRVVKVKEYNSGDEINNKIEIIEEPWSLERVCDDIKAGDLLPVTSSRLYTEAVSGGSSEEPLLTSTEVIGRDTNLCNGRDYLEYECQKSGVTEEILTSEASVLSEQPVTCTDEWKMYISPLYLNQACLVQGAINSHKCKSCNMIFAQLSDLKMHNLIHEGKKPHRCETCDKNFTRKRDLYLHNLTHEAEKTRCCKHCNERFTKLSELKMHNLIHEGKKPFQCETCGKSFILPYLLKMHSSLHEGNKPYNCETCGKSFARLGYLKAHVLIHEGKRRYECKPCGKAFIRLAHLKEHNMSHERKKSLQCKTCGKRFTQLAYLNVHNWTHEGKCSV